MLFINTMKLSLAPLLALGLLACSHPSPPDAAVDELDSSRVDASPARAGADADAEVITGCTPVVCVCGSYGEGCHLEGPSSCFTPAQQKWCAQ